MNDSLLSGPVLPRELAALLTRRSVSPRRLVGPGPTRTEIDLLLQAALRAPDHAGLRPWYVVEFPAEHREALADIFEEEKLRRDPLAGEEDRHRAREHAMRPPALLAFVVAPLVEAQVPEREQWLAAGAALGNLLNAAHALGYGAIVLSGERCFDETLGAQLGVQSREALVGFVSIGRIRAAPRAAASVSVLSVRRCWTPLPCRSSVPEAQTCAGELHGRVSPFGGACCHRG